MSSRLGVVVPGVRAWIDAAGYAITVTGGVLVLASVLTVISGGGGARLNFFVFLWGWIIMAYATFRLWPSKPPDEQPETQYAETLPDVHDTRWQQLTRQLPPLRWIDLPPPERRIPVDGQQFLASLVVLGTSFLLETVVGVG